MEITSRPITEDESVRFREAIMLGFGDDLDDDKFPPERFADLMPLDRTVAVFDADEIVGTLGAFPFEITVPGGRMVAMAGTTFVTVMPTHRRRGVLTAMMRDHLADTIARDEPLAGLWASESLIYGRYGFGVATEHEDVEIDQVRVSVEGEQGTVRLVDGDEAREAFPAPYDAVRRRTPGMLRRDATWWRIETLFDPEKHRDGFTSQRYILHETEGVPDGYAIYRQKGDWSDGFPNGTVKVQEVVTPSMMAHTGIWRFLTSIDLYPNIRYWNLPVDDAIRWKIPDHRRIVRKRWDALYLRILDVARALEARSYASDGALRFALDDPFLPDVGGSFEFVVTGGTGSCRRIDASSVDVTLGAPELASLYLGGGSTHAMARAGLLRGDATSIALLGRIFRGDVAPWCQEVF
ncbi:MAG: GNAT family N-acetyltransferase [Acidimicrobiia bacterium]